MMFRSTLTALSILATCGAVQAQAVTDCDRWEGNARNVVWSDSPSHYANGAITFIHLDNEEPACCSAHVMVTYPAGDEPFLACSMISMNADGLGFSNVSLQDAVSGYDPARGLSLRIPASRYDPEAARSRPFTFTVWVNQATGEVSAR